MRLRRRPLAVLLVATIAAFVAAVIPAPSVSASTVTTPTSCTNTAQAGTTALPVTVSGAATPDPATVGQPVTLTGATFGIGVPGAVLLAGYGLGLLTVGVNNIPADVNLTLLSTGASEASQTVGPIAVTGTTTITDPTPANKTSGDETATPLSVTANVPTTTWTPTGGPLSIRLGPSATTAKVGPGGIIAVTFSCTPGTPTPAGCGPAPAPACTGTNPVPADPFTTIAVNAASNPVPPVCNGETVSVGVGQTIPIDLTDNCSDANGALDLSTLAAGAPSAGTLTPGATAGTFQFLAPASAGTVTFTFTVADAGDPPADPPISNTATVTIQVQEPQPPTCTDETITVAAGATAAIDLSDNCTDPDGDIDLSTLEVTSSLVPTGPGTFSYVAPGAGTVVLQFTVADLNGLVSEPATLTIVAQATTTTTTPPSTTTTAPPVNAPPAPVSGSASYTTTCRNSVTPDISELLFQISGTTLSPVQAGSAVSLTNQTWTVTVPASVLQTGINLGLLHAGDTITGVVTGSVFASNTVQGTLQAPAANISVGPIAVDGGGQALPAVVSFPVADLSWTAVGGDVAYSLANASVAVAIGPISVTFTCEAKQPASPVVITVVRGTTGLTAALPSTQVLAARQEPLARTGADVVLPIGVAVALLDLGYLAITATIPPRRRRLGGPA